MSSAFNQARHIAAAATNLARLKLNIPNAEVEQVAKARLSVCKQCEYKNSDGDGCSICGCPFSLRTRAMGKACPHNPPFWKEAQLE
jgi:DNA-directed RNA polymerase subunit RPC12/RpoP